jgi:hypothetical protein
MSGCLLSCGISLTKSALRALVPIPSRDSQKNLDLVYGALPLSLATVSHGKAGVPGSIPGVRMRSQRVFLFLSGNPLCASFLLSRFLTLKLHSAAVQPRIRSHRKDGNCILCRFSLAFADPWSICTFTRSLVRHSWGHFDSILVLTLFDCLQPPRVQPAVYIGARCPIEACCNSKSITSLNWSESK